MISFRQLKRQQLAIFVDACIVINSYTLASLVLFARWAPLDYYDRLLIFLPVAVLVHCLVNIKFGLYRGLGRYAGLNQALKTVQAVALSIAVLLAAGMIAMPSSASHVIAMVPIGGIIVFIFMSGVRFYPRVFYERSLREVKPTIRLLVVGAGAAGEMIIRSIQKERQLSMDVVALVDDNVELQGFEIHGVAIYGPTERIPEIVAEQDIDEILIAIPSATLEEFQRIWQICSRTGALTKTLRPLQSLHLGKVGINHIRDIEIEDLLGRQPVLTDYTQISNFIRGKSVLITGAGGSIGSELVMQISHHHPAEIILVDQDESALYHVHEKLNQALFYNHKIWVADIRSTAKMELIFRTHQPKLVFHAAAYKHVPLMEMHADEAVLNNVQGTLNVAKFAGEFAAACFVNISTDKAVEPANIMGATKHLSERLVTELGVRYPDTKYCSVRFGNVLGSRGSVVPIFREQILRGGPVTITHPEMSRYFMLISEAVDLVLQAAAYPDNNVVYVLEMGQPVRIVDLASQMISLLKPRESIDIIFTGLRPGEKLHEQLIDTHETREETDHPMIYRMLYPPWARQQILDELPVLFASAEAQDCEAIKSRIQKWVVSYTPFDMRMAGTIDEKSETELTSTSFPGKSSETFNSLIYKWDESDKETRPQG